MINETGPKLWQVAGALAVVVVSVGGMFALTRLTGRPMVTLGPVVGYATVHDQNAVLLAYGLSQGRARYTMAFETFSECQ